jgi:hypothetical protein
MIFHFPEALFSLGRMGAELPFRGGEIDYAIQSQLCD